MLLESEQNGNNITTLYDSSNVLKSIYNTETKDLTITFSNGGKYKYFNVDANTFLGLQENTSIGKFVNSTIKKNFNYEMIGLEDSKKLLSEISAIKEKLGY
jgi:KTSC domain